WLSALSTSCRSTLLTTSNDGSATAASLREPLMTLLAMPCKPPAPRHVYPCPQPVRPAHQAGCPSGQWERTVNPSADAYEGSNPSPATRQNRPDRPGDLISGHEFGHELRCRHGRSVIPSCLRATARQYRDAR